LAAIEANTNQSLLNPNPAAVEAKETRHPAQARPILYATPTGFNLR
jgi:hypothetical protein